jgi:hypothetical protein
MIRGWVELCSLVSAMGEIDKINEIYLIKFGNIPSYFTIYTVKHSVIQNMAFVL